MSRNSCRTPWMNLTNLSVRQALPTSERRPSRLELQVFNVLNLLDPPLGESAIAHGRRADEHEPSRLAVAGRRDDRAGRATDLSLRSRRCVGTAPRTTTPTTRFSWQCDTPSRTYSCWYKSGRTAIPSRSGSPARRSWTDEWHRAGCSPTDTDPACCINNRPRRRRWWSSPGGCAPRSRRLKSPVEFYQESLDLDRFGERGRVSADELLREQVRAVSGSMLVVPVGARALDFAIDQLTGILPGVPIVFALSAAPQTNPAALAPNVTGRLALASRFAPTLEMARGLQPDAERVVIIGGASPIDSATVAAANDGDRRDARHASRVASSKACRSTRC